MSKHAAETDSFAEQNEAAQGMAIPRSIPRLTADEATAAQPEAISVIDLPDDVKKNLNGYHLMELEQMILKTMVILQHPVIIDRIIMTLWIKFQFKVERAKVVKRLQVMQREGITRKIPGSKSTYELTDHGKSLPTGITE